MSHQLLTKKIEERQVLTEVVENLLGKADAEDRDLVPAELEQLQDAEKRMGEIDSQMDSIKSVMERRNSATDVQHLIARQQVQREIAVLQVNERAEAPSLGDFVDSEAYRGWNGHGQSGRFEIDTRLTQVRAPLQEGAAPGANLLPNRVKHVIPQAAALTPLLDAIGRLPVSSNSIDLVTYGDPKGATGAAVVPELTAKPEAAIASTLVTVNVDTIAYYLQASRQLLQDAPAARGLIDDQLRRGLVHKVEAEVSASITGGTYAKTTGAAKAPLIEVARQGMATIQAAGWSPNAILVNPMDAAAFDLALYSKTVLGAAYGANVWGLEVIPVPGLTKAYLGDFRTGVTLLERTGIELFISDSHADTFTKNIFTILAELRAKSVVTNAGAITELVVTP